MAPTALALFCEDIRQEKGDIHSLVGILPDNITVEAVPSMAPKIGIYLRTNFDPTQAIVPISYKLVLPDGTIVVSDVVKAATLEKAKADANSDQNPVASLVSRVIMSPFPLQAGRMQVIVQVGDVELFAGSLNVKVAPTVSSETPQPSGQSPDASQPKDS